MGRYILKVLYETLEFGREFADSKTRAIADKTSYNIATLFSIFFVKNIGEILDNLIKFKELFTISN